jgi:hypothetical protein
MIMTIAAAVSRLPVLLLLLATMSVATSGFSSCHQQLKVFSPPPILRMETALSCSSRRDIFLVVGGAVAASVVPARAAETVGKEEGCNDSSCLGVWDGLLADCPHNNNAAMRGAASLLKTGAGCVSSQDDTPGVFSAPWDYSEAPNSYSLDWQAQMKVLLPTIQFVSARRGDKVDVQRQEGRYLRVLFTDKASGEKSVGEFYFTPNDTTVQYRIGAADPFQSSLASLRNMERGELIRKELRYLNIPVLRNRSRSLFFGESDLDTFGPGSAMLGPPAEMTTGELQGRGSDNVDPRWKFDLVQKFPF